MSTELKRPTTTEIPIQRKEPIQSQLVDPFFDRTLTDPVLDRTLVPPSFDRTTVDPVFDRTLVDPFFDRTQGATLDPFGRQMMADPVNLVNQMMRAVDPMMRPAGWTEQLMNRPFQTLENKELGVLNNILRADVTESNDSWRIHAGKLTVFNITRINIESTDIFNIRL
jgi:hypothetical protein